MKLIEFDVDDVVSVDAYVALGTACDVADSPTGEVPRSRIRQQWEMRVGWDGEVARYFLAYDGDEPVGIISFYAPEHDNRELVWAELKIAPDRRRRGLGRAALEALCAVALESGRPLVTIEGGWDTEAVRGFAEAVGFPLSAVDVRRSQHLGGTAAERAHFEALRAEAEAHSPGYDLVRVDGQTPDHLIEGLVEATAAINDAPIDDLEYEDEVYDADRIRRLEEAQAEGGYRFRRVLAVERATGAIAGHTVVSVPVEEPTYAYQDDTTVVDAHRGHRLGLRLKADMLCWLADAEPQLRRLTTSNAASNGPMIAVNEVLGYRVDGRQLLFQRRLDSPGTGTGSE